MNTPRFARPSINRGSTFMQSFACQARPSRELHPFTAMLFFRFFSYLHINHNGPAEVGLIQVGIFRSTPFMIAPKKLARLRVARLRLALVSTAPLSVAPKRLVTPRSAPVRS